MTPPIRYLFNATNAGLAEWFNWLRLPCIEENVTNEQKTWLDLGVPARDL